MGAPTIRSSASSQQQGNAIWDATAPGTIVAGDLLLAFQSTASAFSAPPTPTGWTLLCSTPWNSTPSNFFSCFGRIATSADVGKPFYVFNGSSSIASGDQAWLVSIGGASADSSLASLVFGVNNGSPLSSTDSSVSITTLAVNSLVLCAFTDNGTGGITPAQGTDLGSITHGGGPLVETDLSWADQSAVGATGVYTAASGTSASVFGSIMVAVQPVAVVATARRKHRLPSPPPSIVNGSHHRGRVPGTPPSLIDAGHLRVKSKQHLNLLPHQGKARRKLPVPALAATPPPVPKCRHAHPKNLPPAKGGKRRGRAPGTGQTATYVVLRRKHPRPQNAPPFAGKHHRAHLPPTGFSPLTFVVPSRRHRPKINLPPFAGKHRHRQGWLAPIIIPVGVIRRKPRHWPALPPFLGHARRRRVPLLALDPTQYVIRRRARHQHGQPPIWLKAPGRSHFPPASLNPLAFVVRRKHSALPYGRPPVQAKHHRGRPPLVVIVAAARPRRKPAGLLNRPPAVGKKRRGKIPPSGLAFGQFVRSRKTHATTIQLPPGIMRRRGRRCWGAGLLPPPSMVGPPYWVVAAQLWAAGAVEGLVCEE